MRSAAKITKAAAKRAKRCGSAKFNGTMKSNAKTTKAKAAAKTTKAKAAAKWADKTMKSAAKTRKAKAAAKRADKSGSVPFDEMCRLMRVYGSTKCLRKRQASDEKAGMKIESVKRKFYRWFPDLEERFVRDAAGFYRPKFGHEFEMRYREDLRAKDGRILANKRDNTRLQRLREGNTKKVVKKVANSNIREVTASAITSGATIASASNCAPVSPMSFRGIRDIDQKLETDSDRSASISVVDDAGPLDGSFVAKRGIFDDVERGFFGLWDAGARNLPPLPPVPSSSRGGAGADGGPRPGASRGGDPPSADRDVDDPLGGSIDKSMEEYCEVVLSSNGDDDCGPVFHFGAL